MILLDFASVTRICKKFQIKTVVDVIMLIWLLDLIIYHVFRVINKDMYEMAIIVIALKDFHMIYLKQNAFKQV